MKPFEEKDSIENIYDSISQDYAEFFNQPSQNLPELIMLLSRKAKVLDAGCGPGDDSAELLSLGHEVIGIDISEKMLEIAQKKAPNATFIKQDICNLDFPANSFDAIVASYSLTYISKKNVKKCLEGFNKALKENGLLYISVQIGETGEIVVDEPFDKDLKLSMNIFSKDEIDNIVKNAGFEIIIEFISPIEENANFDFNEYTLIAKKLKS